QAEQRYQNNAEDLFSQSHDSFLLSAGPTGQPAVGTISLMGCGRSPTPRVVQRFLLDSKILLVSRVSQVIQVTVEQILVVFHAPIFQELFVRLHADPSSRVRDRFGVDLWIFDRELIRDAAGVDVAQTFDDV